MKLPAPPTCVALCVSKRKREPQGKEQQRPCCFKASESDDERYLCLMCGRCTSMCVYCRVLHHRVCTYVLYVCCVIMVERKGGLQGRQADRQTGQARPWRCISVRLILYIYSMGWLGSWDLRSATQRTMVVWVFITTYHEQGDVGAHANAGLGLGWDGPGCDLCGLVQRQSAGLLLL